MLTVQKSPVKKFTLTRTLTISRFLKFTQASEKKIIHMELQLAFYGENSSILPAITDKRVLLGFCMKFKYFEILLDAYLFARFDGFKNALGSWLLR